MKMRVPKNRFAEAELKLTYKKAVNAVKITNGEEAYAYFKTIWDKTLFHLQEQLYVLFLNSQKEVICWRCMHTGTMHNTMIDKRLLFGYAYGCMASSMLIAHNHTSGHVRPSKADTEITRQIILAAKIMDIALLDHLVLGDERYYSLLSDFEVNLIEINKRVR